MPKQLGNDPLEKAFQSCDSDVTSFFFLFAGSPPILSETFCLFCRWERSTLISLISSSYFLNSVLVLCWVQRCEKTLLLILSSKVSPCWIILSANPSRVKGYWKDTLAGNQFSRRIFRSTVIFTFPEMKEKSRTMVWALSFRAISQQYRFLLPFTCLPTSSTSKRRAWICYIQIISQKSHLFMIFVLIATIAALASALPDPTYTIHYLRSYRRDVIQQNFGCGHSIVYGTYLHPMGLVDALYMLSNSHVYNFNSNCQRKHTFIKLFGWAQDYELLSVNPAQVVDVIANSLNRAGSREVIVDWKYPANGSDKGLKTLEEIAAGLQGKAFTVYVKAPASYFCQNVGGKKYILDLPLENLIVELYGEQAGKYISYESVFGPSQPQIEQDGYTAECPKYPSRDQLKSNSQNKKIFFQKTLDSSLPGFVPSSTWQQYLSKAGQPQQELFFYDGYPLQTVDL